MAITFTGTGSWGARIGRIGGLLNAINTYRGSSGTAGTNFNNVQAQFLTTDRDEISALYTRLETLQTALTGSAKYAQGLAQSVTQRMIADDVVLDDTSLKGALTELILQMGTQSQLVVKPVVSVAVVTSGNRDASTTPANSGDGVCIATITDENAKQMDYVFAEKIIVNCTNDSQGLSSPATLGKEPFLAVGQASDDELFSTYPQGSGVSLPLTAVTPGDDATQTTNLLTNGDFENFTTNAPDNFTIVTGAAGASIFKGASNKSYRGSASLNILGDGAELTKLTQSFNTAGQTLGKLAPLTVYGWNYWILSDTVNPTGALQISLVDSTGTIINDAGGTPLSSTVTLSVSVSTTYIPINGFFRTPATLPSLVKVQFKLTTALQNTKNIWIDDLAFTKATRLYNGGPFVSVFSGTTKFVTNDHFKITVANDYSSKWQLLAEKAFNMRDLGLLLPSVAFGGETLADSLVA